MLSFAWHNRCSLLARFQYARPRIKAGGVIEQPLTFAVRARETCLLRENIEKDADLLAIDSDLTVGLIAVFFEVIRQYFCDRKEFGAASNLYAVTDLFAVEYAGSL